MRKRSELTLGVGLAHKLEDALQRNGIHNLRVIDWLASGDNIAQVCALAHQQAAIVPTGEMIDCNKDPETLYGMQVIEHQKTGPVYWDPDRVELYCHEKQSRNGIGGEELQAVMADKSALNANVLTYLHDNPHLIPHDWRDKMIFFWGTIYRHSSGQPAVYFLSFKGGKLGWDYGFYCFGESWHRRATAAVLKMN